MLGVEPRQRCFRVKRGVPFETAILQQLHLEQGIRQTGEVVVVDAGVDKSSRQTQLTDIILDGKLWRPKRHRKPGAVDGVVGHAAVDVVLDGASALGGVGEGASDSDLVTGLGSRVDEGQVGAVEEGVHHLHIAQQRALEEGNIGEGFELLGDDALEGMDLSAHVVADGGGDADERGGLAAGRVHDGDSLALLGHPG